MQAVKPAGRPELNPSAVDKTAVLDVVDDVGNSVRGCGGVYALRSQRFVLDKKTGWYFYSDLSRRLQALNLNSNGLEAAE